MEDLLNSPLHKNHSSALEITYIKKGIHIIMEELIIKKEDEQIML